MNILMLCDEYPPGRHGGIGTAVQLLARTLVKNGHSVVVAGLYSRSYGGDHLFVDEGVTVYRFYYGFPGLVRQEKLTVKIAYAALRYSGMLQRSIVSGLRRYGKALQQIIRRHDIQICEMPDFQGYMPFVTRYTTFPALSVPVIVKLHGTLSYFAYESGTSPSAAIFRSEQEILMSADNVCSVSRYTALQTAHYFDYSRNIDVLYNGISIPHIKAVSKTTPPTVIFSGTLVAKKGIYQLMKAWNLLHEELPEAELHVHGKGPVTEVAALLSPGARKSVHFYGHTRREELMNALAKASVAVFPSYAECFALAPMEAMAMGTAVIYTTRSSGPELITDGEDGLLCDPDDVKGLAEKTKFLLRNTHFCTEIAIRGQATVLQKFSIDHIAEEHIAYYQNTLEHNSFEH